MANRAAKIALFDAFASVAQALGNGRRAEIVDVLAQGERSVEELGEQIGKSIANTSHHLQVLARAGLVRSRREGTRVYYRLAGPPVRHLGAVGRPDLNGSGDPEPLARRLHHSIGRLLELPDHVLVYPSHYGGSLCGRTLSGNPFSSIGVERTHNLALLHAHAESLAQALLADRPPAPADQARIVAANRAGTVAVEA